MISYGSYTPNFKCGTDENGKGIVNSNIGLISVDELELTGSYFSITLVKTNSFESTGWFWTMSSAMYSILSSKSCVWYSRNATTITASYINLTKLALHPVINLKADVIVLSGTGKIADPYVVQ